MVYSELKIVKSNTKYIAQMSKGVYKVEKYVIKSIEKMQGSEVKATVRYVRGIASTPVKSKRAIYRKDGLTTILFKGIRLGVAFNDEGFATNIEVKEIYDNKVKKEDSERANKFRLEIKNENDLGTSKVEQDIEVVIPTVDESKTVKHIKFNHIKACVESSVPAYLHGPAGSGKNHVLQQIAEELNLEFYFTNSVQQEYKITGFIDAGGTYHETEFYKAFKHGGLFFLDEMDASIPEVLILLNASLANGYFEFPNGKIYAHKDFRVVSAGNTVGAGADEQYVGRLQLDQATLDRFAMIEFDYDRNIELVIAKGNEALVQFVRNLRAEADSKGIAATFSYRCITMVTQLESKLDLVEIIKMAVVKGLDKDTINTFTTIPSNKYSRALKELKQQAG